MKFTCGYEIVSRMPRFDQGTISRELTLWNADPEYFAAHGGPISRAFVQALPEDWKKDDIVLKSKLAWLKIGWSPAQGDYHGDQVPLRSDGEQDFQHITTKIDSIACCVGDCSLTCFVFGEFELPDYPIGQKQGMLWHNHLIDMINDGVIEERAVEECTLIQFSNTDFHRAMPATKEGFRIIFRAVRNTDVRERNVIVNTTQNSY